MAPVLTSNGKDVVTLAILVLQIMVFVFPTFLPHRQTLWLVDCSTDVLQLKPTHSLADILTDIA